MCGMLITRHHTPARQESMMRPRARGAGDHAIATCAGVLTRALEISPSSSMLHLHGYTTAYLHGGRSPDARVPLGPHPTAQRAPAHRLDRVIINPVGHTVRPYARATLSFSTRVRPARPVRGDLELAFSCGSYLLEETRCRVGPALSDPASPANQKRSSIGVSHFVGFAIVLLSF